MLFRLVICDWSQSFLTSLCLTALARDCVSLPNPNQINNLMLLLSTVEQATAFVWAISRIKSNQSVT